MHEFLLNFCAPLKTHLIRDLISEKFINFMISHNLFEINAPNSISKDPNISHYA